MEVLTENSSYLIPIPMNIREEFLSNISHLETIKVIFIKSIIINQKQLWRLKYDLISDFHLDWNFKQSENVQLISIIPVCLRFTDYWVIYFLNLFTWSSGEHLKVMIFQVNSLSNGSGCPIQLYVCFSIDRSEVMLIFRTNTLWIFAKTSCLITPV